MSHNSSIAPYFSPRFSEEESLIYDQHFISSYRMGWDASEWNDTEKKGQGHNLEIRKAKGAFGQGRI